MDSEPAVLKAEIILADAIYVPEDVEIPVRISKSTAGPGAGSESIVLEFGGHRVKKSISRVPGRYSLGNGKLGLEIRRDGETVAEKVSIIPVGFHCPEQAFFNLDQRCIFDCAYCASPLLDPSSYKGQDAETMVSKIRSSPTPIRAVAITSGVVGSVQETVDRIICCISRIHEEFPELPIGVEPYVDDTSQIDSLHRAGATEIKINCETATRELFCRLCRGLDYDNVFGMLGHAVEVFGRGNVTSNVIIGLGETDQEVEDVVRRLASMGVVAGLRPLKVNHLTAERLREAAGDLQPLEPSRVARLAAVHKKVLSENGLVTDMQTMCMRCTCCDIVPWKDA